MGRVFSEADIENLEDLLALERNLCKAEDVRRIHGPDALVDTGATMLSLPSSMIQQLGLRNKGTKRVSSSTGIGQAAIYGIVRLTIQVCEYSTDVMEVPDGCPVLIGQLPLGIPRLCS